MSYLEHAARGELALPRCVRCGQYCEPGVPACPSCAADLAWVPVSGNATVYSYAVVHQVFRPEFAADVPYVVALVELAEGPRLITRLVGFGAVRPSVGAPVRVAFRQVGKQMLPVFTPA